jgi:hypothetical protein
MLKLYIYVKVHIKIMISSSLSTENWTSDSPYKSQHSKEQP